MKSRTLTALGLMLPALIALGLAKPAQAVIITYNFQGTISNVDPALSSAFSAGDTLTGSYSFESTTPPRAGSTSASAVFDALTSLNFSTPGYSVSTTGAPEIQVDNDPDRYAVVARASDGLTGPNVGVNALNAFGFRLDDSTNSIFKDALILPTSLSLTSFDSNQIFIFFVDNEANLRIVDGTLTSLTAVPEPASMAVWSVIGVLAMTIAWWRSRTPR